SRKDVLSAWSGLRPLVSNPKAADTARLSRDHVVNVSPSGLITVAGGKWTTYRKMALDAVEEAIKLNKLKANPSKTESTLLVGAPRYRPELPRELETTFHLPADIAIHLSRSYGDRAERVAALSQENLGKRLASYHPFLEAEVIYGIREEGAQTAVDVLARRTRLAFLDRNAAEEALPRVLELMAQELGWNGLRRAEEEKNALAYLK